MELEQQKQERLARLEDERNIRDQQRETELLRQHARKVYEKRERERKRKQAEQAVLADLQKTGGPRDVLRVLPEKPKKRPREKNIVDYIEQEKKRQKEEGRKQEKEEYRVPEVTRLRVHKGMKPVPTLDLGAAAREQRAAMQHSKDNPTLYLASQTMRDIAEADAERRGVKRKGRDSQHLGGTDAKRQLSGGYQESVSSMMNEHKRLKDAEKRALKARNTASMISSIRRTYARDLAALQSANPVQTETINREPDVSNSDPASGAIAPSGTGQEPQMSAVDNDLRQLAQQLDSGAEMGDQSLEEGGEAFGMPIPQQGILGPAGGIEAVEKEREELVKPTSANLLPTDVARPEMDKSGADLIREDQARRLAAMPSLPPAVPGALDSPMKPTVAQTEALPDLSNLPRESRTFEKDTLDPRARNVPVVRALPKAKPNLMASVVTDPQQPATVPTLPQFKKDTLDPRARTAPVLPKAKPRIDPTRVDKPTLETKDPTLGLQNLPKLLRPKRKSLLKTKKGRKIDTTVLDPDKRNVTFALTDPPPFVDPVAPKPLPTDKKGKKKGTGENPVGLADLKKPVTLPGTRPTPVDPRNKGKKKGTGENPVGLADLKKPVTLPGTRPTPVDPRNKNPVGLADFKKPVTLPGTRPAPVDPRNKGKKKGTGENPVGLADLKKPVTLPGTRHTPVVDPRNPLNYNPLNNPLVNPTTANLLPPLGGMPALLDDPRDLLDTDVRLDPVRPAAPNVARVSTNPPAVVPIPQVDPTTPNLQPINTNTQTSNNPITTTTQNPQLTNRTNPQFTNRPTTTTNPRLTTGRMTTGASTSRGGGGGRGGRGGGRGGRGGQGGRGGGGRGEGGRAQTGPITTGPTNIRIGGGYGGGSGGAVASASSSGASGSGGAQGAQTAGALLAAIRKPKGKKKQSGITAAKKRYTDKRKVKLGELRALKSKRLREHATKTKKLPKSERDKQRKAYKQKVNTQFKEVTKRFPTARGLRDLQTVRSLIDKIDRVRLPS